MNFKLTSPLSNEKINEILTQLTHESEKLEDPLITRISKTNRDPFMILIATILSLRTKDEITHMVSQELFEKADTPQKMLQLPLEELESTIYPVGFYRRKAESIRSICKTLIDEYEGTVPDSIDELLKFKGIGRKTANLVVIKGYNKPGICVDVHVARITQRIGIVPIKGMKDNEPIFRDADNVEMVLRKILPRKWWVPINDILVRWGQNICTPISPKCSQCVIIKDCLRIGVIKNR